MPNIRIFYHKKGAAKYISHLDITRCMQRALKRASIPVWYTQGFNPHMYMTFALPLPLGYDSECEVMDLRLTTKMDFNQLIHRLNLALPRDIRAQRAALQKHKPQEIQRAEYELTFRCQNPSQAQRFYESFAQLLAQKQILVQKKTKKGVKEIDIRPEFSLLEQHILDSDVQFLMQFTAGQKNINPTLLTDPFFETHPTDIISLNVLRKQIYLADGSLFE